MSLRTLVLTSAMALLAACSTTSMRIPVPTATLPPDQSRLVLLQMNTRVVHTEYKILLDGRKTCGIAFGEALVWDLPPGDHEITFRNPGMPQSATLAFRAEPGRTTYVSSEANTASGTFGILGALAVTAAEKKKSTSAWVILEEVSEEFGQGVMASLSPHAGCPYPTEKPKPAPREDSAKAG